MAHTPLLPASALPSAHNFHRHVTKRPLRWLDAWRETLTGGLMHGGRHLKVSPLHASSHLNVLLPTFLFVSADVALCFSFSTFPSCHVPSPPHAHADNEENGSLCARGHLQVPSFIPQAISGSASSCLVSFWAISLPKHLHSAVFSLLALFLRLPLPPVRLMTLALAPAMEGLLSA
jgi:hypothetical protein